MAVIKVKVARGGSAGFLIHYIGNPNKTDDCEFVTGIHCSPNSNNAALDMDQIKKIYNKERGVRGYHIIQSFLPGEVDAELAHEIGVQMAKELWGDRFQIYVGTHVDRNHIHNHIFVNSVSYRDGKKLRWNKTEYFNIRATSDKYCEGCGLSVIDSEKSRKYFNTTKRFADRYMKTNPKMVQLRQDIDDAIYLAESFGDFIQVMGTFGYDVWHDNSWDWKYYYVTDRVTKIRYSPDQLFGREYRRYGTEDKIWANHGLKRDTYLVEGISKSLIASVYMPGIVNFAILLLIINAVLEIVLEIQKQHMQNNEVLRKHENLTKAYANFEKEQASKKVNRANKIVDMNKLLSENNITSENDLQSFKLKLQSDISKLRNYKEDLVTSVRKHGDIDNTSQKILEVNKQIDKINNDLKTINYIEYELKKIQATKLVLERERENTRVKEEQRKLAKKLRDKNAR